MAILTHTTLVAALLLAACQRSPTVIEIERHSLTLHAVLIAGSDSATVLLTRPTVPAYERDPTRSLPVTNALVRLVHGADMIVLSGAGGCAREPTGAPVTAGCYTARVPGGIRAATTYELVVNVPGEQPIHGSTRVPSLPQILEPNPSAEAPVVRMFGHPTLLPTPLTVRWSAGATNVRTELRFIADRSDCSVALGGFSPNHVALMDRDTAVVMVHSVQCGSMPAETYSARLVVTVYDESYTRYTEYEWYDDPNQARPTRVGLTGAFGVFGAAASSAVPVVLSRQ